MLGRAAARAVGRRFLVQWAVTISLAIIAAAAVEYTIGAQQLYRVTLEDATATHLRHAEQLADEVEGITDPHRRLSTVYRELGRLEESSSGVVHLAAYDDGMRLLAQRGLASHLPPTPEAAAQVLATGEPVVDRHRSEVSGTQHYAFLLLVDAADGPMVLFVEQEARVVESLVTRLGFAKLAGLGVTLVVAVPLSYVLGGRAMKRRQEVAELAATTDPLTGLGGRRAFEPTLDAQVRGTARAATALAVLDLDGFKEVNDTHGHAHGDRVLQAVACAADALRAGDSLFRLGGDEFAVILPGAAGSDAEHVLDRFRARFTDLSGGVTMSVGVAAVEKGSLADATVLWARADAALYEAKRRGRRCTVVWTEGCCHGTEPVSVHSAPA